MIRSTSADSNKKGATVTTATPLSKYTQIADYASITFFHFARTLSRSSGEDSATGGNSFIHSKGRQASMTALELKPFLPGWMRGSSGPLQQRRRISMDSAGSERDANAHKTSNVLVGSMSSSTTITYRP